MHECTLGAASGKQSHQGLTSWVQVCGGSIDGWAGCSTHMLWVRAECAGVIHTDFEKKFIRAETVSHYDFVACEGLLGAKEKGRLRLEGKDVPVLE